MITTYHRPSSLDEALALLSRPTPVTLPLGGGTALSHYRGQDIEVVDLQSLGMNRISEHGNVLQVGAMVTLQQLLEMPSCPPGLAASLRLEAPLNLRTSSSLAGTLVVADGRSTLATVLLALDARLTLKLGPSASLPLGEYLPRRSQLGHGYLITAVEWPLGAAVEFDYVARTPADIPIVDIGVARWPSGRTRAAVGGWGASPLLALDGADAAGVEPAVRNALSDANDAWGSASYRMDAAAVLARRCLARLQ